MSDEMKYPVMNLVEDLGNDWRFKFVDPQAVGGYAYVLIPKNLANWVSLEPVEPPEDYGLNLVFGGHYE